MEINCESNGTPQGIQWISDWYLMGIQREPVGKPMGIQWGCNGNPMGIPWAAHWQSNGKPLGHYHENELGKNENGDGDPVEDPWESACECHGNPMDIAWGREHTGYQIEIQWESNRVGMHNACAPWKVEANEKPCLVELIQCACPSKACLVKQRHTALERRPRDLFSKAKKPKENQAMPFT